MKKSELADVKAKDFVIFKTGTWNGETFTEADLDRMAANYDPNDPPHFFLGHSSDYKGKTTIPSWGRITKGLKRIGNELIAQGAMFHEQMAEWIKEGFFNQRSVEITKDNKRIIAIGLLGAMPPAVKGMPLMQEVFKDAALQYSAFNDSKCIEFVEDDMEDKTKDLSEICGRFIEGIEPLITDHNLDDAIVKKVIEFQDELATALEVKIPDTETRWKQFTEKIKSLFNKRKESKNMDEPKQKEYQDKIAALETEKATLEAQNKEFAEKERLANEAKAQAEKDAAKQAIETKAKEFCETAIKDNKMLPAQKDNNIKLYIAVAETGEENLKLFQAQFDKPIVPLGVTDLGNAENDTRPQIIQQADKYVKAHTSEFSGMTATDAINRAVYLQSTGKINFEAIK